MLYPVRTDMNFQVSILKVKKKKCLDQDFSTLYCLMLWTQSFFIVVAELLRMFNTLLVYLLDAYYNICLSHC